MVFYYLFHTLYHQKRQYMHQKVHLFVVYLLSTTDFKSIASINKEITL